MRFPFYLLTLTLLMLTQQSLGEVPSNSDLLKMVSTPLQDYIKNKPDLFFQRSLTLLDNENLDLVARSAVVANVQNALRSGFAPTDQFNHIEGINKISVAFSANKQMGGSHNFALDFEIATEKVNPNFQIELFQGTTKLASLTQNQFSGRPGPYPVYIAHYEKWFGSFAPGKYTLAIVLGGQTHKLHFLWDEFPAPSKWPPFKPTKKLDKLKGLAEWNNYQSENFNPQLDIRRVYLSLHPKIGEAPSWRETWEPGLPTQMAFPLLSTPSPVLGTTYAEIKSWGSLDVVQVLNYLQPAP